MARVGFIGLGIMGKPMAKNLIRSGYSLVVYNRSRPAMAEVAEQGALEGQSPKDVAAQCDVVITMLPNSPEVTEVVSGDNGILSGAKAGTILIDMSSIAPLVSKQLGELAADKGVIMLDAPVSGGEPKAIDGTLAIMVGGPMTAFEQVRPILEVLGASVTHVGELGSGNTTKLANQIIVGLNIAAMCEAMTLATSAGVNPEKVYQAIRAGLSGSTVLDAKLPKVLKGDFKPGFRIKLHLKDMANAQNTAHALGVVTPLSSMVMEIMKALVADGKGDHDHCGIMEFYEKLSKVAVRE